MNFLQKFRDFVSTPTHSRTMGLLVMLVLVAAVSLTVIVAQQQQQIKQRAETPNYCADIEILECPDSVKNRDNDCSVTPDFKCWKPKDDGTRDVWGCVTPAPTQ